MCCIWLFKGIITLLKCKYMWNSPLFQQYLDIAITDNFSPYCRSEIFTLLPPDSTSSVLETWWRPWPLAPRAASCRDNSCHVPVLAGPWPPLASAFTRLLTSSYVSRRWLRLCVGVHGLKKASGSKYLIQALWAVLHSHCVKSAAKLLFSAPSTLTCITVGGSARTIARSDSINPPAVGRPLTWNT